MANTIRDWTVDYLLRFIRAELERVPLPVPRILNVGDIVLKGDLDLTNGRLVQSSGATNGDHFQYENGIWKPTA